MKVIHLVNKYLLTDCYNLTNNTLVRVVRPDSQKFNTSETNCMENTIPESSKSLKEQKGLLAEQ